MEILTTWIFQGQCHFGHFQWFRANADRWVWLTAWGLLLVFYSNHTPKTHHFCTIGMGLTDRHRPMDREMDGSQYCLMTHYTFGGGGTITALWYATLPATWL